MSLLFGNQLFFRLSQSKAAATEFAILALIRGVETECVRFRETPGDEGQRCSRGAECLLCTRKQNRDGARRGQG